ncbi:hypothetical protein GFK16_22705, partial [Salmonella enterica subsp. enterica serovar Enteritidis]|nr:hypothetical protein [Salmonella enterica subsp. enterica serovar Enteritidis]
VKEKIGYGMGDAASHIIFDNVMLYMKRLFTAMIIAFITVTASSSALACPKGQHPHGDTGSHHKGGWCSYEQ